MTLPIGPESLPDDVPFAPEVKGGYLRPLIIERPDLQSLAQRWGYRSVTVLCWLLWLYLFVPLLSFAAWFAGLSIIYQLLLQDLDVDRLWSMLAVYFTGIGMFTGTFLLWAFYSYMRFRNTERRQFAPIVDTQTLAASHGLDTETVENWRSEASQVISAETLTRLFHDGEMDP
ncbi:MAG: biofilm PGA synthesis protein PgaD [Limisphaerales bacterium]